MSRVSAFFRHPTIRVASRTLLIVTALIGIGEFFLLIASTLKEPSLLTTGGGYTASVDVDFGLSRMSLMRTVEVNLCANPQQTPFPECASESLSPPSPTSVPLSSAANQAARPTVLSAEVIGDLSGPSGHFPADQLAVTATNVGRQVLAVTLQADPRNPTTVPGGL